MDKTRFGRAAAMCAALILALGGAAEETTTMPAVVTEPPAEILSATEIPGTQEPAETTNAPVEPTDMPEEPTDAPEDAIDAPTEPTDAPADATDAPAEESVVIAIAAPSPAEATLERKPALEEVLAVLPGTLTATLADGAQADISVRWICAGYELDAAEYVFLAELAEPGYVLGEDVAMPGFTLRIQPKRELTHGDFVFAVDEQGRLMLTGWTGTGCVASVPAEVDGAPVVAVAKSAFAGNQWMTDVVLPEGVVALEAGAFENCTSLTRASLPDSLEVVGGEPFAGCGALDVLELRISNETSTADNRGYDRRIVEVDEDGRETVREVRVELGRDWTDARVEDGGKWRIDGAVAVASGHGVVVAGGGAVYVAGNASVTVNGALTNAGSARNDGVIYACGGSVSGMDGEIVRDHRYVDGICSVCGARQTVMLNVVPLTAAFERTYDGSGGMDVGPKDFAVEGVREGDEVYIAAVNTSFNESAAGSYLVGASFQLGGADAAYYSALPMELNVVIHKKQVTVTPRAGQSKVYGAEDPFLRAGYRGVVSGETLAGRLGRESGEGVGTYRITMGTLADSNPNYEIVLGAATFEIVPKSLSDAGITVARIVNQRYTGQPLTPAVEVRDGKRPLVQGVDYELSYADNVDPGSARVNLVGHGNYEGECTAGFRIIKVSGGAAGDPGDPKTMFPSSGGANDAGMPAVQQTRRFSEGNLVLDGTDWGTILFDEEDQPRAFHWSERVQTRLDGVHSSLCIEAEALRDEQGEILEGDFGQPRLRMSMEQIAALRRAGFTDVEFAVGAVQTRFPLDALFAEYVDGESTMSVVGYEVRLWPLVAEALAEDEAQVLSEQALAAQPCHFEMLALPADGALNVDGTACLPMDVLSLLTDVKLAFAAETAEEGAAYALVRVEMEEPEAAHAAEAIAPAAEEAGMFYVVTPVSGGMYAIVRG